MEKILELVASSKYSIHDLSRCQAREACEYYRLNMPFELGLDFGCRRFGAGRLARKVILVLEEERFRYQAAISRTIRPRSFLRPCSNGTLNGRARSADLRANTASGHDGHEKAKRSRTGAIPPIPEQPMHEDPRHKHHGPSTRGGVK